MKFGTPTALEGRKNGSAEEMADLQASYEHLCKMRDEIVTLGIVPAVADWKKENPNL